MLSSRNRRLKRVSRIIAFFVIVFSGCWYQMKLVFNSFSSYTSSDEFMRESVFVPPIVRSIYLKQQELNAQKLKR